MIDFNAAGCVTGREQVLTEANFLLTLDGRAEDAGHDDDPCCDGLKERF